MQRGYGAVSIIKEEWLCILVSATNIFISMWGGVKWLFNWVDFIKFQLPVLNHSRCPSIHLEAIISSPGSPLPPPHSPNYPPVPTPSSLYCYMICSKSSPEGGPHHHLLSPSPGGWGDKLSAPLPWLSTPLLQISFSSLSPFLSSSHSLLAHVGIILQQLISQPGCTQSSPSVLLFHCSVCHPVSSFLPSDIVLLSLRGLGRNRGWVHLKCNQHLHICVCVCRRLNTLNKCALMRLEISPQRKRVSAHAHVDSILLR